jgi:hypothetical protein
MNRYASPSQARITVPFHMRAPRVERALAKIIKRDRKGNLVQFEKYVNNFVSLRENYDRASRSALTPLNT